MVASLRALLAGIVDFAGLFPPARLPLEQAIGNYARYRGEPRSWILGRFVCPAARLIELEPMAHLFHSALPTDFSVLGRGGESADSFMAGLRADIDAIQNFRRRHEGLVRVDAFEVRLPPEVCQANSGPALNRLLGQSVDVLEQAGLPTAYETSAPPGGTAPYQQVITTLASFHSGRKPAAFKWRAGGLEAAAFPPLEQVAFLIATCRDHAIPWKATAGLHHPLGHFDPGIRATMHGFINVFAAGVLAWTQHLAEEQLRALLAEESPRSFHFDDDGFRWRDFQVATQEITAARKQAALSFGSCSFDEPCDTLCTLGWIEVEPR